MGKISLVLFMITVAMGVAGRMYYSSTQETIIGLNQNIATLQANQVQMEQALETSNETIQRQQEQAEQFAEANQVLRDRMERAETYQDELASKLSRHDLTQLTLQRPQMIEDRVNAATESIFDELEIITGRDSATTP